MFFQSIYQMITAGTDLNINIRKEDNSLSVAVIPRRNSLKEDTRHNMVSLVVDGTTAQLDMGFLQTILQPIQKVQGLLVNAENFEKQAEKATSQAKSSKTPTVPAESKEAREKREKMEKLLKKADDATAAKRFSEAMTWLKQARVLAPSEKQKEIDEKMQENSPRIWRRNRSALLASKENFLRFLSQALAKRFRRSFLIPKSHYLCDNAKLAKFLDMTKR